MENSCQNYPERLGYCFHSNGFKKKRCVFGRSAEMHLGFYCGKITMQNYWMVVKTTNLRNNLTTEHTFNKMITCMANY